MKEEIAAALKNKHFLLLWSSQFLSQVAVNVMTFLLILKTFSETGSTIASSMVWVVFILPAIFLAPFSAAYVDTVDRRKVLIFSNLAQGLVILGYSFIHSSYFFLSYGVVLAYSLLNQFYVPAELATLPTVVPEKSLAFANGLFLITLQIAVVIGYGTAGLLSNAIGFGGTFMAMSTTLFIAFIAVWFLPSMKPGAKLDKFGGGILRFFRGTMEGYDFIRRDANVYIPFLLIVSLQVALAVVLVNLPALAVDVLGVKANYAGSLIAFPAGFGAFLGTLLIPKLTFMFRKKVIIDWSFLFLTGALWSLVFIVPYISNDYVRIPYLVFNFSILGLSFVNIFITAQTYLQVMTPTALMGRVFGNIWFTTTSATVLPLLFSATITEILGVRQLAFTLGLLVLIAWAFSVKYGDKLLRVKNE